MKEDLQRIQEKTQQLVKQLQVLRNQNAKLEASLEALQQQQSQKEQKHQLQQQGQQQKLEELQQQIAVLKLNNGSLDNQDRKELEKKINHYIKEIDRCIAQLGE